jgi:hypothetical protein
VTKTVSFVRNWKPFNARRSLLQVSFWSIRDMFQFFLSMIVDAEVINYWANEPFPFNDDNSENELCQTSSNDSFLLTI